MTKVSSTISHLSIKSTISQLGVKSTISQKGVSGAITESGVTHYPPVYVSSEVGLVLSNQINILFDKRIDVGSVPDDGDFVVTFSGGALTWGVFIFDDGNPVYTVSLVLSRNIAPGETGTVAYTPGVSPIKNYTTGDNAEAFTGSVTNNVVGTVPLFVSAAVANATPTKVVLTYDQTLDTGSVPATTDFTLAGKTISNVAIVGATVEVTVSVRYYNGDVIAISYTKGTNPIQGDVGELDAANLVNQSVTNNITDTVPLFVSAAVANATPTKVVLTYNQTLDGASVPATTDFTVTDHTISGVAIVGATVELTLSTAFIYFDILYVTYTKGANPIQGDVGELDAADLASTLITNNVVVTGNEVAWLLASDLTTITKDGSDFVSAWNDKLASGRDLLQATGTNQPLWSASGITFDGVDNFMKAVAFTWNQPEFIIIVLKQITWASNDTFFDGKTALTGRLYQRTSSPFITINAGTILSNNGNLVINTIGIVRVLFNGASSKLQVNNTTATTGNVGTANMGGFTLGARSDPGYYSNIQVIEIIGLKVAPSADYETSLYNVVKRRNGL